MIIMRIMVSLFFVIPFIVWMIFDGVKTRSKAITLVPDLLHTLSDSAWEKVETGLSYKKAALLPSRLFKAGGQKPFTVYVWRFDPKLFKLRVVNQYSQSGSKIKEYRQKTGALLAINGGFFSIEKGHVLKASGLVVIDGTSLSPFQKGAGSGLLYEKEGEIGIGWARQAEKYGALTQALQVGPMVVDPDGQNGIARNDGHYAKRSVLCQDFKGRFLIIIIDGKISLYETGKLLSTSEKRGGLSCERALNLDGGPSTMVDYKHKGKSVYIAGRWPVVNALVLKAR